MNRLGKVTEPLADDRGPDVTFPIQVPQDWLVRGESIVVQLPRRLSCARCEGGGCDACERRGALSLREAAEAPTSLSINLAPTEPGVTQLLRIPEAGAKAGKPGCGRGCLMLRVAPGELSPGVQLPATAQRKHGHVDAAAIKMWLLLPVLLVLVYLLISALV